MTEGTRATSYYSRGDVAVTSRHLIIGRRRFEVVELLDLQQSRGSTHPGVLVGLIIAVAEGALVAPFIGIVSSPAGWAVAALALAIPCLVGLFCARRWPAQYELLADYRGRQILLFTSRDLTEFGQVSRALRRAVEASDASR